MKIGILSVLLCNKDLEDMLDYVSESGLDMIEVGTGDNPGDKFCKLDESSENEDKRQAFTKSIADRGLQIDGFSCHNNPTSPDPIEVKEADETLHKIIRLVNLLDMSVVSIFSSIAGLDNAVKKSNWPITPWPIAYSEIYDYQWNEKLVPYWQDLAEFAKEQDAKVAIELRAGFLVYTPYTMLKLRGATNEYIGANLDPSHLWWQGIDPIAAICILGQANAIHHSHAEGAYTNQKNVNIYGLADIQPYDNVATRAWTFRTAGYRHSPYVQAGIMSQLIIDGYGCVSGIEYEDPIMSAEEGFQKACQALKSISIYDKPADMWWV